MTPPTWVTVPVFLMRENPKSEESKLEATFAKCKPGSNTSKENANTPLWAEAHMNNPAWTLRDVSLLQIHDAPGTQHPSRTILTTSNCRSLNIRPSSTGTRRQCRKKGCICMKKALPTRVKDFASCEGGRKKNLSRESKQLQQTYAPLLKLCWFHPKSNWACESKEKPTELTHQFRPTGCRSGWWFPARREEREKWSKLVLCCLWGIWSN